MEWLRSVDLAEYAPNLRGSGVHGGLIVSQLSLVIKVLVLMRFKYYHTLNIYNIHKIVKSIVKKQVPF